MLVIFFAFSWTFALLHFLFHIVAHSPGRTLITFLISPQFTFLVLNTNFFPGLFFTSAYAEPDRTHMFRRPRRDRKQDRRYADETNKSTKNTDERNQASPGIAHMTCPKEQSGHKLKESKVSTSNYDRIFQATLATSTHGLFCPTTKDSNSTADGG